MHNKDRDVRAYYYDVLQSINHIFQFLDSGNIRDLEDYHVNILIKSAVERKLEVIGEDQQNFQNRRNADHHKL